MKRIALALLLAGCRPDVPPADVDGAADVCIVACDRRAAMGCLEPKLAAACVPVCHAARRKRLYDPVCVARAQRDEMAACGVRCDR